jgi:hypothetical protein
VRAAPQRNCPKYSERKTKEITAMCWQHNFRSILLFGLFAIASASTSHSASFLMDDDSFEKPALRMSGVIASGDSERLVAVILPRLAAKRVDTFPVSLVLDSTGGSVQEAVRIAALVETLRLQTKVRGDELKEGTSPGVCASACFLIWLAGYERHASGYFAPSGDQLADKTFAVAQRVSGMVGLHRPYLDMSKFSPSSLGLAQSQQRQAMASLRTYLHDRSVAPKLVNTMMAHTSRNIYWLRPDEVNDLSISPEHEELLAAKCEYRRTIITSDSSRRELEAFLHEQSADVQQRRWACSRSLIAELRKSELPALGIRINAGWRPWQ